jgi:hypothetical protein
MEITMQYAAVVKGGLHANYSGALASIDATGGTSIMDSNLRLAAQALDRKGAYAARKMLNVLIGAAPGANSQYLYSEIVPAEDMGGVRPVNWNPTLIANHATTAADATALKNALTVLSTLTHTVEQSINYDRNPLGTR